MLFLNLRAAPPPVEPGEQPGNGHIIPPAGTNREPMKGAAPAVDGPAVLHGQVRQEVEFITVHTVKQAPPVSQPVLWSLPVPPALAAAPDVARTGEQTGLSFDTAESDSMGRLTVIGPIVGAISPGTITPETVKTAVTQSPAAPAGSTNSQVVRLEAPAGPTLTWTYEDEKVARLDETEKLEVLRAPGHWVIAPAEAQPVPPPGRPEERPSV